MENRRKYFRIECLFKVKSSVQDNGDSVAAVAKDICEGGICILTDIPLPDYPLTFRFSFEESKDVIDIQGRVVWSRKLHNDFGKFESGVEFLPRQDDSKISIENLIKELQ